MTGVVGEGSCRDEPPGPQSSGASSRGCPLSAGVGDAVLGGGGGGSRFDASPEPPPSGNPASATYYSWLTVFAVAADVPQAVSASIHGPNMDNNSIPGSCAFIHLQFISGGKNVCFVCLWY